MVELLLKKKGTELLCGKCGDLSWCAGRKAECRDQSIPRELWHGPNGILRSTACLAAERKAKKLRAEIAALKAELVAEKERAAFHLYLIERAEVLLRRVRPGGYLFSMDHMMADLLLKDIEKE